MACNLAHGAHAVAASMESPIEVTKKMASEASVEDLLSADGYLFCAPENLATVSGEMAEFFHRCYYHVFESHGDSSRLLGRPFGLAIAAGSDGSGAARQVSRICQGWRLKPVVDTPLIVQNGLPQTAANILAPKACSSEAAARCQELGGLVAAHVLLRLDDAQ